MSVADNNPVGTEQAQPGRLLPAPAQAQPGQTQVSSEDQKLYTQAEMDKSNKHAAESEAGRVRAEERKALREKENALELRALEGQDSSVIDAGKARIAAKTLKDEAEDRNAEADSKVTVANETLAKAEAIISVAKATEMASKHNIDTNLLLSFTTDITKMEALALILPKVDPNAPIVEINPDPGTSAGAGGADAASLAKVDTRGMKPSELAEHQSKLRNAAKGQRIK